MRIAWVTYDFEEYSSCHVNALCRDHDLLLVMPRQHGGDRNYPIDAKVDYFAFDKPRFRQPLRQWKVARRILGRIDAFSPDVIHFQQGHMWFNFALGRLRRYPLVITIHNPRHHAGDVASRKTPQWIFDYGFRKADHVIVHGSALASQVEQLFHIQRDRIHVIPHVAMGHPASDREIRQDPNLILFFGRIWDYKGLDQLIAAQPRINAVLPGARIMIAGQGEDFDRYRRIMKDPSKFIVDNSQVSDQKREEYFRRSALVVLPYNEATQTGVVPVAYNYGRAVVATRVGALAECVDDGVTGLLIPPRDPDAIADAVIALLKEPARLQQMGRAAKAKLDRECSPAAVAEQTAAVYRIAISQRRLCRPEPPKSSAVNDCEGQTEGSEISTCKS